MVNCSSDGSSIGGADTKLVVLSVLYTASDLCNIYIYILCATERGWRLIQAHDAPSLGSISLNSFFLFFKHQVFVPE